MVGWSHQLDVRKFGQAPGVGDGQESLVCCSPWGRKDTKLCPTLCNPMNYNSTGSSVHGILQARIQEWVAIPSSQGSCTESVPNAS